MCFEVTPYVRGRSPWWLHPSLSLALEWSQNRWESKGRDPLGAIMNNLKENDNGKTKERVHVI